MTARPLDRRFGREAFGADPAGYHAARPAYPDQLYAALRAKAGLAHGVRILEIGAGTGTATDALLAARPSRLLAVEPDVRSADHLRARQADPALEVLAQPFEAADLPDAAFDLVCSATAFHWLEAGPALAKVRRTLAPGGTVALWWNVFGDSDRPDPFHDATQGLFAGHRPSLSDGAGDRPYGLDLARRQADLAAAGFTPDDPVLWRWTLTLDPAGVRALYATYSNVNALSSDDRARLLDGLAEIAERQFAGRVERNMTTALYVARKPS